MAEEKFRFLTSEEFNKLQQSEKLDYLARAVAALEGRRGGCSSFSPMPTTL